jgi:23S rRNA (adenine2030-N6)-methyltransferase
MNYRHSFHAGNFADVVKHAVLARILAHLALKPTPFRVIDTHAGAGLYDLTARDAERTGEWREGIARLDEGPLSPGAEAVLAPFRAALEALAPVAPGKTRKTYPGSPAFIRHALRETDSASLNELHPETFKALTEAMPHDGRLTLNKLDGYLAWKAQVPPSERRGLVLVDPPFEQPDEFARMAAGLKAMARKWPTGIAMLWYPIKDRRGVADFEAAALDSGFAKLSVIELHVDAHDAEGPLAASGLMIANPPWTLNDEMAALLPDLAERLARGPVARWRVEALLEG